MISFDFYPKVGDRVVCLSNVVSKGIYKGDVYKNIKIGKTYIVAGAFGTYFYCENVLGVFESDYFIPESLYTEAGKILYTQGEEK